MWGGGGGGGGRDDRRRGWLKSIGCQCGGIWLKTIGCFEEYATSQSALSR